MKDWFCVGKKGSAQHRAILKLKEGQTAEGKRNKMLKGPERESVNALVGSSTGKSASGQKYRGQCRPREHAAHHWKRKRPSKTAEGKIGGTKLKNGKGRRKSKNGGHPVRGRKK